MPLFPNSNCTLSPCPPRSGLALACFKQRQAKMTQIINNPFNKDAFKILFLVFELYFGPRLDICQVIEPSVRVECVLTLTGASYKLHRQYILSNIWTQRPVSSGQTSDIRCLQGQRVRGSDWSGCCRSGLSLVSPGHTPGMPETAPVNMRCLQCPTLTNISGCETGPS